MDISAITALNSVNGTATVSPTSLTGMLAEKEKKAEGTMFETFHSAPPILLRPYRCKMQVKLRAVVLSHCHPLVKSVWKT